MRINVWEEILIFVGFSGLLGICFVWLRWLSIKIYILYKMLNMFVDLGFKKYVVMIGGSIGSVIL